MHLSKVNTCDGASTVMFWGRHNGCVDLLILSLLSC